MLRSLFSGIGGLRAHQQMMDVTGNNIANVNSVGFKASQVVFDDTSTGGNAVVTLSGIDQALLSYSQLTGWPYEAPQSYRQNLVMWDPIPDYLAFRALLSRGEITLGQWLRQVVRADTTPLYETIAHYIDANMLVKIAAEYQKGRLLIIQTTDLDAGQPVGSYAYDGLWFDIGRRDDYERALKAWSNGNAFASETDD